MAYFIQIDSGGPTSIASTKGFGDFGRWVDHLGADEFGQLIHLMEWGWCQKVAQLADELEAAIKAHPPDGSVKDIAQGILDSLRETGDAAVVTITDGFGEGEDDSEKSVRAALLRAGYSDDEAAERIVKSASDAPPARDL